MFIRLLEYCKNGHCSRFCFINNAVFDYGAISADSYFNETNSRLDDRFLPTTITHTAADSMVMIKALC